MTDVELNEPTMSPLLKGGVTPADGWADCLQAPSLGNYVHVWSVRTTNRLRPGGTLVSGEGPNLRSMLPASCVGPGWGLQIPDFASMVRAPVGPHSASCPLAGRYKDGFFIEMELGPLLACKDR